ncbi:MAG: TnpV protein [Clostridium sp.]|nr:TnpV protein [Clostridium sp.]
MIEDEGLLKLGRYGIMAMNYLKENHETRYKSLLRFGRLAEKMQEVEERANQRQDLLISAYLESNPPADRNSTMEMWQIRQQAQLQAEEIVIQEVINQYH